jgi:hypothetical protein
LSVLQSTISDYPLVFSSFSYIHCLKIFLGLSDRRSIGLCNVFLLYITDDFSIIKHTDRFRMIYWCNFLVKSYAHKMCMTKRWYKLSSLVWSECLVYWYLVEQYSYYSIEEVYVVFKHKTFASFINQINLKRGGSPNEALLMMRVCISVWSCTFYVRRIWLKNCISRSYETDLYNNCIVQLNINKPNILTIMSTSNFSG